MSKKIRVSGIAVKEGTSRNNRKYEAKELKTFAPTLIGRPILKDHEGYTDNVIGKITQAESTNNDTIVTYEGWVKEDGTNIIDKIQDGRINEVSIGAIAGKVVKDKEDSNILIPLNMEALELSTTPVPGNKGTSLYINPVTNESIFKDVEYTEESLKNIIEEFDIKNNERRFEMESDDSKKIDEPKKEEENESLQSEIAQMKEVAESLKQEKASLQKEKESLEKARIADAIERYNEKAKAKGIEPKDMSKATLEMVKFATEMVDELPKPKEEDEDEPDEKSKEKAKSKIKEHDESEEDEDEDEKDELENYKCTQEDVVGKGYAFFKYY